MNEQEKEITKKLHEQYEKRMSDPRNMYDYNRRHNYPSWQEQMDLLYHGGVDALKAELKKTKDKFPKPE